MKVCCSENPTVTEWGQYPGFRGSRVTGLMGPLWGLGA